MSPGRAQPLFHGRIKGLRKNNFPILCADATCLAVVPKRSNISMCLHLGAVPDSRLNA
jgi:hypothetical protein